MAEPTDAWDRFCDELRRAGRRILDDDFPVGDRHTAEGYRYLGRLAVFALQSAVEFDDADVPAFHRYDDDVVKWGGPNADNVYLRARVRPDAVYRITGRVDGVHELIISVHEGDMQLGQYGVFGEANLAQLAVGRDGSLEVILGGEPVDGNWLPLDERARYVIVRQYLVDWTRDVPADLCIERVGGAGLAPAPITGPELARRLDTAGHWFTSSLEYWRAYLDGVATRQPPNVVSPPRSAPGGATDILYGGGIYGLAADEALLVTFDEPSARYWSIQLYSMGWFESLDIANRQTSLNGAQAHVDPDGRVRVVLAERDPGVPNWLDLDGHHRGMVAYRWVWSSDAPVPDTEVVGLEALRARLPAGHPVVDAAGRRAAIAARQRHVARRFRR